MGGIIIIPSPVGVEHHPVVARLGNGPATGERRQARPRRARNRPFTASRCRWPPAGRALSIPQLARATTSSKSWGTVGVGRGVADQVPHRLDSALVGGGDLGHQLLGQDVERGDGRLEHVEAALPHRGEQRGALDQLVAVSGRAVRPASRPDGGWPGPPAAGRCRWRGRADLADQLDRADVDPELE